MMPQRQPERIVSGQAFDEDARIDVSVRPKRLDEYIGQKRVKENIQIAIDAALSRGEALDHVLLYGPPGLGKTTLAQIIANELNVPIKTSAGPLLERKGDLTAILTALEKKEVFFLDEIHRLQPAVEEVLYPAMEDFRVDLIIGQGPGARIHPFPLGHFTLIGATTRAGLITAPLRSRFGIVHRLDFYEPADLLIIIHRSAKILNIQMDEGGAEEIAGRCRGTPRIANRLLRRARDFAEVRAAGRITGERQFIIIGSQSLHGKYPDLPDEILTSFEVDLIASKTADRTEWLNVIGIDSPFHETFGYYADPVDASTATLPRGWKGRLVSLPPGETEGVKGLCLEPHDLAIAKYAAAREKDLIFTRELARRGIVFEERLLSLLDQTPVDREVRERMRSQIAGDFHAEKEINVPPRLDEVGRGRKPTRTRALERNDSAQNPANDSDNDTH